MIGTGLQVGAPETAEESRAVGSARRYQLPNVWISLFPRSLQRGAFELSFLAREHARNWREKKRKRGGDADDLKSRQDGSEGEGAGGKELSVTHSRTHTQLHSMRLARRHLGHLDGEHRLDLRLLIRCEGETEALLDNLILHPIEALAHIVAVDDLCLR